MSDYTIQYEEYVSEPLRREWEDFWTTSRHAYPHQHYVYGECEKVLGRQPVYIMGRENGKVTFVGLFSVKSLWGTPRAFEAVCLRGPVFDDIKLGEWCLREIVQYFKHRGVGSIRIGPNWTFPEAEGVESMLFQLGFTIYEKWHPQGRRSTGLVDLNRSEDELIKSFDKGTRQKLRIAERVGISMLPLSDFPRAIIFYHELKKMHRSRGITCLGENEFQVLFHQVLKDSDLGVILGAYIEDVFLGGILVLRDGHRAYTSKFVVLNEVIKRFTNTSLAPMAFWQAMRWAKEKGCQSLDVEGYSSESHPARQLELVYKYKRGFNPEEIKVLGQYYLPCSKVLFLSHKLYAKMLSISKKPMRTLNTIRVVMTKRRIRKHPGPSDVT